MAQAGIHGLVGMVVRKWTPKKEWLILGIVLGNMLPDMDALAVAYATLSGMDSHGLHRTFSHSIPFILGLTLIFYLISAVTKRARIGNLGLGLGIGMLMHSLLDLVIWFRGVELFWPFYGEINFWSGYTPPAWWHNSFESAAEFLLVAVFFLFLASLARKQGTDEDFLRKLKSWTWFQFALFVIFLVLVYTWDGYFIPFGAMYIFSLSLALGVTVRMRKTIETMGSPV
jgi:membrane-bound metal-dependent hydrolase YbcI (DUF457 family)